MEKKRVMAIRIADGQLLNLDDDSLDELALGISQQNRQSWLRLVQGTGNMWTLEIGNSLRRPLDAASLDKLAVVFGQWREPPTDDYLTAAIECMSRSIDITADGDAELVTRLLDLSEFCRWRYKRRSHGADLRYAVRMIERAATLITPSHQSYPNFVSIYAEVACLDISLLNGAVSNFYELRNLMAEDLNLFQLYAKVLCCRYDRHNNLEDLKTAIKVLEEIAASKSSAKIRLCAFASLAQWYGRLYEREPQRTYLDLGVQKGREPSEALWELPCVSSDEAHVFGALAEAFRYRYLHVGKRIDLYDAVLNGKAAVQLAIDTDPDKPGWLNNLAAAYELLFEMAGDMDKLELAIRSMEDSLRLTPRDGPEKARRLNNLANQLGRRFDWTNETEYLDHSIQKLEEAVHYEQQSSFEQASELKNLGSAYIQRFTRKRNPKDLRNSIEVVRKALNHFAEGDISVPGCYYLLGKGLELLYETASMNPENEITESNESYEKAVSLCAEGHPHRAYYQLNLGRVYGRQFDRHGRKNIEDLDKAITLVENTLRLTSVDTPGRVEPLIYLGCMLPMRFLIKEDPEDMADGLRYYKEAVALSNGYPLLRIKAARFAIRLLKMTKDWAEMKSLGETAMQLLPLVCGRYQSLDDQQQALIQTSGLAADVCSILLKMGSPEEALRKLEFGKGLVIGYLIDNRDDLMALRASCPELSRKYESIRRRLYLSPDELEPRITESQMRERRTAAQDMDKCLQEIRQTEGHEDFLGELPVDQMMACAEEGPIVVVNVTDISSNAILISTSQVRAIALPNIEPSSIPDFISDNIRGFGSFEEEFNRDRKLTVVSELWRKSMSKEDSLAWLWRTCVKVVLDELKVAGMISAEGLLPRIWWIGSGVASSFPFHAAGSSFQNGEDALSQMIPSYSPSIKTLLHSRQRSQGYQQSPRVEQRVTVVTMATTPGHATLSGVSKESDAIKEACDGIYSHRELRQPDVRLVLKSIADSDIVHFACHGASDVRNPTQSFLLLQKNGQLGAVGDKLSVSKMLGVEGTRFAWISYLSACSTAETRVSQLADEGLHISSAMQLAGFAHVIGSIWPVDDTVCVDVASSFYKSLIAKRDQWPGNRAVADALREAILHVRQRYSTPWKWAAYIHSGA
jgi:hypothetical protein